MASTLETVGFGIISFVGVAFGLIMNGLNKRIDKLESGKLDKTEIDLKLQNVILQTTVTLSERFKVFEKALDIKMKPIEDAVLLMKNNIRKREND